MDHILRDLQTEIDVIRLPPARLLTELELQRAATAFRCRANTARMCHRQTSH